jgi:hypothetical protein
MSSCCHVSGGAGLAIKSPTLRQPLARTPRPCIGPVLFDVVQTRSAVRFALHHPLTGWHIGEGRPQAVLLLVVDQDKKTAIVVIQRIDAHRFSRPPSRDEWNHLKPYWRPTGAVRGFGKFVVTVDRGSDDTSNARPPSCCAARARPLLPASIPDVNGGTLRLPRDRDPTGGSRSSHSAKAGRASQPPRDVVGDLR